MNKEKLWQAVLAQLQLILSRSNFSLWFKKTFIKKIKSQGQKQVVEIAVPSLFAKETIETNWQQQTKEILESLTGKKTKIVFVVKTKTKPLDVKTSGPLFDFDAEKEKRNLLKKSLLKAGLNQNYTFQNFAVAPTNEMAYAAATAVSKTPGKAYNPLFIYGGVGVGKTHLMQAMGIGFLQRKPQGSVLYKTGEDFTNEIIEAIRRKNTGFFKKKYRNVAFLLIDDIQFIAGRDTVQEEFFHTFNAIKQMGGQIVLTSDRSPEEIEKLESRLRSRFEGGLTIDVQEPNFELRTAILLIKAKQAGEEIPIETAKFIAQQVESTRKLEGVLIRILSEKRLRGKKITPETIKEILKKPEKETKTSSPRASSKEIVSRVAQFYQLKVSQIKGKRRLKQIVFPRQVAIFLLRRELGLTYQEIGRMFGGRDHTTIMHSEKKIKEIVKKSPETKKEISSIKQGLA